MINKTQLSIEDYEICSKLKSMRFSGMAEALEEVFEDPNAELLPFREKIQRIVDAEWNLRYSKKLNRFIKKSTLKYPAADLDDTIYNPERQLDVHIIEELSKAEKLDTYQEELNLFAGYDLLVVDDFGLMNMDVNKCRNLFEVFDSRDPHKSILVISQFPVSAWYDMFQDHTYAEACLARMLSGAYRLEMNGKNMRNMESINK